MALPLTSLNAATATGPGAVKDLEGSFDFHTIFVHSTGGASWSVTLEGSHDGVNWDAMATVTYSGNIDTMTPVSGLLVRYVRANLISLTGGTSPTITASIASKTS